MPNDTVDRRDEILDVLSRNGKVYVSDLSKKFSVSKVTLRNDLKRLEQDGFLRRIHGGALKTHQVAVDLALAEKEKKHAEEKRMISRVAAEMIEDGDTIILDSGTTTMEIARSIKNRTGITVITNALNIAMELANQQGIEVIIAGGNLREKSFALVGPHAEHLLSEYYADKFFLGVDGFSSRYGVTTPNIMEARLNRIMVEHAREVIVVTDSSKFGKRSLSLIVTIDKIDRVITDKDIPEDELAALQKAGKEVISV